MKVKLNIPTNLDDITVGQYQDIQKLIEEKELSGIELDDEILKIVLKFDNLESISVKDKNELYRDVSVALTQKGEFKNRFTLNGIEYGLIPNFDNISNGEYTDLIKYSNDEVDLHRFLAVAYRPIKNKDTFNNYKIKEYKGTSAHAENMKNLPMSIANGVQLFFLNLSKDLKNYIQTSMAQELARE